MKLTNLFAVALCMIALTGTNAESTPPLSRKLFDLENLGDAATCAAFFVSNPDAAFEKKSAGGEVCDSCCNLDCSFPHMNCKVSGVGCECSIPWWVWVGGGVILCALFGVGAKNTNNNQVA